MVALDEGNYPSAYARRAGVDRMSMSRYLRDIGEKSRTGGPGLGLVEVVSDPDHAPRQKVLLTEKGRALLLRATRPVHATEPDQKPMVG
jgi:DNA-binding MarR family transcriptional regulator